MKYDDNMIMSYALVLVQCTKMIKNKIHVRKDRERKIIIKSIGILKPIK